MKIPLRQLLVFLTIAQLCPPQTIQAQHYQSEKVLYLDAGGQPTREKNAVLLQQVLKLDDTLWQVSLYRMNGPMVLSACSSDPDGRILSGQYITYDRMGFEDTIGAYYKGKREGRWKFYALGGRVEMGQVLYKDGQVALTMDSVRLKREADSLEAVYTKDWSQAEGTIFSKVEIQSAFPGGSSAWLYYLTKNLRYPDYDVDKNISGQVEVVFVVDKEGLVLPLSIRMSRSIEYHLDQEAIRLIARSRRWVPAIQNGHQVVSYKRQPFVFEINR